MAGKPQIKTTMSAAHFDLCTRLNSRSTPEHLILSVRPVLVDGVAPVEARAPYADQVTRQGKSNFVAHMRSIHAESVMIMSLPEFETCTHVLGFLADEPRLAGARSTG